MYTTIISAGLIDFYGSVYKDFVNSQKSVNRV